MQADLEAMTSSQRSLSSELGTELMARLSEEDQNEVRIKLERKLFHIQSVNQMRKNRQFNEIWKFGCSEIFRAESRNVSYPFLFLCARVIMTHANSLFCSFAILHF
jgi:hypothetical protein